MSSSSWRSRAPPPTPPDMTPAEERLWMKTFYPERVQRTPRQDFTKPDSNISMDYLCNMIYRKIVERTRCPQDQYREAFNMFDNPIDGMSVREFKRHMLRMGVPIEERDVERLFQHMDTDGNGRLSFQEMVNYVMPRDYGYDCWGVESAYKNDASYIQKAMHMKGLELEPEEHSEVLSLDHLKSMLYRKVIERTRVAQDQQRETYMLFGSPAKGLSFDEFGEHLSRLGISLDQHDVKRLFRSFGLNSEGMVEFQAMLSGITPKDYNYDCWGHEKTEKDSFSYIRHAMRMSQEDDPGATTMTLKGGTTPDNPLYQHHDIPPVPKHANERPWPLGQEQVQRRGQGQGHGASSSVSGHETVADDGQRWVHGDVTARSDYTDYSAGGFTTERWLRPASARSRKPARLSAPAAIAAAAATSAAQAEKQEAMARVQGDMALRMNAAQSVMRQQAKAVRAASRGGDGGGRMGRMSANLSGGATSVNQATSAIVNTARHIAHKKPPRAKPGAGSRGMKAQGGNWLSSTAGPAGGGVAAVRAMRKTNVPTSNTMPAGYFQQSFQNSYRSATPRSYRAGGAGVGAGAGAANFSARSRYTPRSARPSARW